MKTIFQVLNITLLILLSASVKAQDCKTSADLDATPGKYLTAAQYPWPAARAEYFMNLKTAANKALAKNTLENVEKIEQQSHTGFNLTGGNWENTFSSKGYQYFDNTKLGQYYFQAAFYEHICINGKLKQNGEYATVLRSYINEVKLSSLGRFLYSPFGTSMGSYDLNIQYADWKHHQPADVNAKLISLLNYITCISPELLDAINTGNNSFQDVAEKDMKLNNRSNYITRYWFIKKKDIPVLLPVSRNEYLQSLLEYYDREKIYFPKLIAKLKADKDNSIKYYANWEKDVADKIAIVQKTLNEQNEEWLSKQAIINPLSDNGRRYNAKLAEQTNYNRFWQFDDNETKSLPLYKYNPEYFNPNQKGPAAPQIITVAFRYITMPSSLRLLNNFIAHFDFESLRKIVN